MWDAGFQRMVVGILASEYGLLGYWLANKGCWAIGFLLLVVGVLAFE